MKQLLTMFMVLVVSVAVAQRPEPTAQKIFDVDDSRTTTGLELKQSKDEYPLDTLMPGNWENRTGVAGYIWGEAEGYFFGTNTYNDQGYGQKFEVDDSYYIYGALFWFAFAEGSTGDVVFTVWDWNDEEGIPGEVLAQTAVPLANIESSGTFDGAFYVEFLDEEGYPILHSDTTGNYVIGADVTDLDGYVAGEYGLGTFSSVIGDGIETLAYIHEEVGWINASAYLGDAELDIAVFPLVSEEYFNILFPVDFYVNMTNATYGDDKDFDPDAHEVYITGSFMDWIEPGTDTFGLMNMVSPNEYQEVFVENFDGGAIPAGWENIDANEDDNSWEIVTTPAYSPAVGNFAAMSKSWTQEIGDIEPDNWLITPSIPIPYNDYDLSFKVKAQDANKPEEKISVYISTTTTDLESFTEVESMTLSSVEWVDISVSLDGYVGEDIHIAFRHWDCEGQYQLILDNIIISGTPELIYHASFNNVDISLGEHEYKYFVVEDDPTWDFGEWPGDPNRGIIIEGEMSMNDNWAQPVTYDVTFDIVDESGEEIKDATVTFGRAKEDNDNGEEEEEDLYTFTANWGTFEYMIEAEGYKSVEGEILVTEDHTEEITMQLLRKITFLPKNEENKIIEDLKVAVYEEGALLQEIPAGSGSEYIFEDVVAGTYEFLMVDGSGKYVTVFAEMTVTDDVNRPNIAKSVNMQDGYMVEFNVDMTEATFDHFGNTVDFNPDAHDVYVSASLLGWVSDNGYGSMTSWAEPGSDASKDLGYIMSSEDGVNYTSELTFVAPTEFYEYKYYVVQNDLASWDHPEYDAEGYNRTFSIEDDDVVLYNTWGKQPFHVTFNVDMTAAENFNPEEDVVYITGDLVGWTEPGDDPDNQTMTRVEESMIYTITLELTAGDYQYKYFLNEGWGDGEWEGEPNREITVEEDKSLNDGWGDLAYSTGPQQDISTISLFPNPARDIINVVSDDAVINSVQVYDLTGRIVHNANIEDNRTVIDVSSFNHGVYIIRIQTDKGFEHHKFQVTR